MAEDMIITYETLYDILRREKNRAELQELSETYLQDLINYLQKNKGDIKVPRKKEINLHEHRNPKNKETDRIHTKDNKRAI